MGISASGFEIFCEGLKKQTAELHAPGDYVKNGVYYCCKCNQPKQKIDIDPFNPTKTMRTYKQCQCEKEAEKQAEKVKKEEKINKAKTECFSSKRAFEQTFENDNLSHPEISQKLKNNYIAHFSDYKKDGTGLLLYGGTGTGKTFLARAVLHKLIEEGYTAKEIKIIKAYNLYRASGEAIEDFIEQLKRFSVIYIDDLGTERTNEAITEFVYNIVDTLYENKTPIIFTSNLTNKLFEQYNEDVSTGRIYSRIFNSCVTFEVNGKDLRSENRKNIHTQWLEFSEQK